MVEALPFWMQWRLWFWSWCCDSTQKLDENVPEILNFNISGFPITSSETGPPTVSLYELWSDTVKVVKVSRCAAKLCCDVNLQYLESRVQRLFCCPSQNWSWWDFFAFTFNILHNNKWLVIVTAANFMWQPASVKKIGSFTDFNEIPRKSQWTHELIGHCSTFQRDFELESSKDQSSFALNEEWFWLIMQSTMLQPCIILILRPYYGYRWHYVG